MIVSNTLKLKKPLDKNNMHFRFIVLILIIILPTIGKTSVPALKSNYNSELIKPRDIIGIGFVEVDLVTFVNNDYIRRNLTVPYGIDKGSSSPVGKEMVNSLKKDFSNCIVLPSGEVVTLLLIYASLGGKVDLTTILPDDNYSSYFLESFQAHKVKLINDVNLANYHTKFNLVYLTPEGASTKIINDNENTTKIAQKDIKYHLIKNYKMIVTDARLWDESIQSKAILRAFNIAEKVNTKRVLLLSNSSVIKQYSKSLLNLINKLDILITDETSIKELFKTSNLDTIFNKLKAYNKLIVITKDDKEIILVNGQEILIIPNYRHTTSKIIDESGFQPAFAAGFLYGQSKHLNPLQSAKLGNSVASQIVQQIGCYPQQSLKGVLVENSSN